MDWITRIPADVFDKAMANNVMLAEQFGQRYVQMLRLGAMLDQKSSSMLTYLAILLAGVSVLLVGESEAGAASGVMGGLIALEFAIVFAAAFLFLSCARTSSFSILQGEDAEAVFAQGMAMINGRFARFNVGFALAVIGSFLFAVLVFIRIAAQYFL